MVLPAEPNLQDLVSVARDLYVGISHRRIGPMSDESEIVPLEDAQKSCASIVSDLSRLIAAKTNKVSEGK